MTIQEYLVFQLEDFFNYFLKGVNMSKRFVIGVILAVVFSTGLFFGRTNAEGTNQKMISPSRVAVVDVRDVLQRAKSHSDFLEKMQKETDKVRDELKMLSDEIKRDSEALDTRKKGTDEYFSMAKELMDKEAKLESRKEFEKNLVTLKEKQWTEDTYEKVHKAIATVAEKMGIDIVLDGNGDLTREIPSPSPNELVLTIRTRKVLYFTNSIDITEEVLAEVNK